MPNLFIGSQVVFADCLEGNDLLVEQSARMNLYTEKSLNKLLQRGGRRDLSSFELKEWKKSLYGKFYQVSIPAPFQGQGEHCILN